MSLEDPLLFERDTWAPCLSRICGIDEAGRGPLAGPVVAAAVILPDDFQHATLTDSKQLKPDEREAIYEELTNRRDVIWSAALVDAQEIDQIDILRATWKAMVKARDGLAEKPSWTLVDGLRVPSLGWRQTPIVGGDALSLPISAASVIAKVTRDRLMVKMHEIYPLYGFAGHKGYGTPFHLEAIFKWGPCPIHRLSFEPIVGFASKHKVVEQFLFQETFIGSLPARI